MKGYVGKKLLELLLDSVGKVDFVGLLAGFLDRAVLPKLKEMVLKTDNKVDDALVAKFEEFVAALKD